jgi:internalin A
MTPEEADHYKEALSRILEAEETGAVELHLNGLFELPELPPELGRLTSLESLDLSWCFGLKNLEPLSKLTRLQTLELGVFRDPSLLANLAFLQTLRSDHCDLSDLSPLANLTSLQTLDLEGCERLSGDLFPLAGLTALKTLRLSGCEHLSGGLSPLEKLIGLRILHLSECHGLSIDLSLLAKLTKLQTLYLSGYFELTGDLSHLDQLTELQNLCLNGYFELSNLSPLGKLTALRTLDLDGCQQIQDLSPLADLAGLQSLRLATCERLSNLSPVGNLTALQTLNLFGCNQLRDLSPLARLTTLQTLRLSHCLELDDLVPLANLATLQTLDLSRCFRVSNLLPLAHLPVLQTLDLAQCEQLRDLTPLASLISLQKLVLSHCRLIDDASPLAGLTALKRLNLSGCGGIRQFGPLKPMLPTLEELSLFNCQFDDLPAEVCGENWTENVLAKIRAHYADLESGVFRDAELKVFFLGNGQVGKTQLCRRLQGLEFDREISTTHGVELAETTVELEDFPAPVRLNLWDFGGQDIYHGSHTLFLHGQAIFLLLWTADVQDGSGGSQENELVFRHRPFSYWLDYLQAFAGTESSVVIVQSQCDTPDRRRPHPPAATASFSVWTAAVSSKTGLGLDLLKANVKEAIRDRFYRRPPLPIGAGRVAVRNRLRQMLREDQTLPPPQRRHRLLEREDFDRLCAETGGVSDSGALLDFLHRNGVVFYRSGLFGDRIVLDQNWALEAIYSIFDRKRIFPLLRGYGRFTRRDLETLVWSDYTPAEQNIFLDMMESCGICFRARKFPDDEWEYLAPELLPKMSGAQELLLGRLRDDAPGSAALAHYSFLHDGILRGYLSKLGEHAKDAAIYWKYGCWFYEQKSRSQVLIESGWENAGSEFGPGTVRLQAWGENAEGLIDPLLRALQSLPVGQSPEIKRIHNAKEVVNAGVGVSSDAMVESNAHRLDSLEITAPDELPNKSRPEIFLSYAWGDDSSEDARQRGEIVERLCETLEKEGWKIIRDKNAMRAGDLISGFMKRIGKGDRVIVVLSDKYLRSPFCMFELHAIYQRSHTQKPEFLTRIIPVVLNDARFDEFQYRDAYAEYWTTEFETMEQSLTRLAAEHKLSRVADDDFRHFKEMQKWYLDVADMLAYITDVLTPYGFDEILKDDFAGLRRMLGEPRT